MRVVSVHNQVTLLGTPLSGKWIAIFASSSTEMPSGAENSSGHTYTVDVLLRRQDSHN